LPLELGNIARMASVCPLRVRLASAAAGDRRNHRHRGDITRKHDPNKTGCVDLAHDNGQCISLDKGFLLQTKDRAHCLSD